MVEKQAGIPGISEGKPAVKDASLKETRVDEIYPEHVEALHKAGLAPEVFLMFGEIWEKDDGRLTRKKKKQRDSRTIYFVIGYSQFIRDVGIPKLMKQLHQQYRLKWLC
eukprot:3295736-Ditylum_brightwellii.AAC.1